MPTDPSEQSQHFYTLAGSPNVSHCLAQTEDAIYSSALGKEKRPLTATGKLAWEPQLQDLQDPFSLKDIHVPWP